MGYGATVPVALSSEASQKLGETDTPTTKLWRCHMSSFSFPPYGEFARQYNELVNSNALAPISWKPGLASVDREESWIEWRKETLSLINEVLWPQWDPAIKDWVSPDLAAMHALTKCDFSLFHEIEQESVLNKKPVTAVSAMSIPSHKEFFQDEDSPGKIGTRYYFYDCTLPSEQLQLFVDGPNSFSKILESKCGSASIQIKQKIQRPRAYQVAKMMGLSHKFERAITSMTASMSSGHCFEGCLIGAGIYEQWLNGGFNPTKEQLGALQQYCVDIGDRRVFAGVHYPSDNLSSWIISLRLVSEVCPNPQVGHILADAIKTKSYVFSLLKSSGFDEYKPALSLFRWSTLSLLRKLRVGLLPPQIEATSP
jgi:hypothetical protein